MIPETHSDESGYFSLSEAHDGKLHIGTTKYGHNAYLVEFDPRSEKQRIVMDVHSRLSGGARLALAFHGSAGYIESPPIFIRPGINPDIAFDLSTATFKTEATDWSYKAVLADKGATRQVTSWYIIIYPQQANGDIRITNVRLIAR